MDRISYLVKRYLDNVCTRQEMEELLDHIKLHPDDDRVVAALEMLWEEEDRYADRPGFRRLSAESAENARTVPAGAGRHARSRGYMWKVAASILLLAACLWGAWLWPGKVPTPLVENRPAKERSVETSTSEHRFIVLPDKSKVWIKGESRLVYGPAFDRRTREVVLEGEAFFDIAHDERRPFVIRTGKVRTTVLGTSFSIRAFPGENVVTVTVTRGKVRVEAENNAAETLTANQQLTLDVRSSQLKQRVVDAVRATQWIKSDLILHEVTLDEIEEILEERYSVDIRFETSELQRCRFTSTFYRDATLEEVMTAICLVNGASYKISGDVITISGTGCAME